MTRIVYADANVYLAMFLEERGKWLDPCDEAVNFFNRVFGGEFLLGYSDFVVYEVENVLKRKGKDHRIMKEFIRTLEEDALLVKSEQEPTDVDEAKKIDAHYQDPLHALLARRIGCDALVSYDYHGFPQECCDWLTICKPESLF